MIRWLEDRLFPKVVDFSVHPLHITFLLILWIALLALSAGFAAFALLGGNYFNGISGIAACIVLLQQNKLSRAVAQQRIENHHMRDLLHSLHRHHGVPIPPVVIHPED